MVNNFNSIKLFLLISVLHNVNAQCGVGLKSCGNQCYSPDSYVCYSNGLLCPVGTKGCNDSCYDPALYSCVNNALVSGSGKGDQNKYTIVDQEPEQEPKQEPESVSNGCPFEALGYKCCSSCTVYYIDESGKWGVENNEWCGIVPLFCNNQSQKPLDACFAENLGYPCCKGCDSVYVDDDGEWGVENNEWCGIKDDCSSNTSNDKAITSSTSSKKTTTSNIKTTTTNKSSSKPTIRSIDEMNLVFSDEFDGNSLDKSVWDVEINCWGGGNGEKQCYVDHEENIFVKDGQLHLKAVPKGEYKLTDAEMKACTNNNENSCGWTQNVTSGRIRTYKSGNAWKYGKVRVKAKLPSGPYLWPAIWMLPQDDVYGTWAASGEIDIMEARGQVPDAVGHAIHFGGQWPNNDFMAETANIKNVINDFHVYGLDWEEDFLIFTVDETPYYTIDLRKSFWSGKGTNPYKDIRQPFDQKFHLLLNVAVGGNYFGEQGTFDFARDTAQWTRPEMIIDYVRVYQLPEHISDIKPIESVNTSPPLDGPQPEIPNIDEYELVFSDEFEGNSLDKSVWDVEVNCWGGGNGEKQCYVDHEENIFVKDGQLHLKAVPKGEYKLTDAEMKACTNNNENSCGWTQNVTSGRIRTYKSGNAWKYGKVRVKAKLPAGPYLWPAIWMLPQDDVYGTWAASGEIDIMEARGQIPDEFGNAIHFGGQWPNNDFMAETAKVKNVINDFHVYGIDWEKDYMLFSVDEKVTFYIDLRRSFWSGKGTNPYKDIRQPFDQKFHLLLNVAVGGNYFGEQGTFDFARDTAQWTRPEMIIDYVRVYQLPEHISDIKPIESVNTSPPLDGPQPEIPNIDEYELVFSDEFEGNSLDKSVWDVEVNCWGGGNGEKQCYVDHEENIFVKDGQLHLKAVPKGEYKLTDAEMKACTNNNENSCGWTQNVTSGRIRTYKSGNAWKYGKVRVKAKLPSGPYLWPAIWMLPQDDVYGTWAASGEIDIMEARGQIPDEFGNAIHFGGQWPNNDFMAETAKVKNVINDFHVYGIDWEKDYMLFSVDEKVTFYIDLRRSFWSGKGTNPYKDIRQPFDQKFHLLLNVAVGGNYFGEQGTFDFARDTAQWTRPEMIIDYVRVYQKK